MTISASTVKQLREMTGAGMMDCKKALSETDGDLDAAVDWLRKKGLSKAAKKASRAAAEGLVSLATSSDNKTGVAVEINAETDFVGRNQDFQQFVQKVTEIAVEHTDVESLASANLDGKSISDSLTDLIAKIGENMALRRMAALSVEQGAVCSYVHNAVVDNMGRIGVLVALESEADQDRLQALGKQIAMHVAAVNPQFLNVESVDADALERERQVLSEQARASGKPEEIIGKMVEGRLRKYYEEVVLLEQVFVMDGETKIKDVVANAAKEAGKPIALTGFVRFNLGEGVEKEETDFAAEVAAAVNG